MGFRKGLTDSLSSYFSTSDSSHVPNTNVNPDLSNDGQDVTTMELGQISVRDDDADLIEKINTMIMDTTSLDVKWDDIAGLELEKQTLREMVVLPTIRKDTCTRLPGGLLLFGFKSGCGKTMLVKAVATECNATFFWVPSHTNWGAGQGDTLIRTLFTVAKSRQPSLIFFHGIDCMVSSREAKSEFLAQLDELIISNSNNNLVTVFGSTNRPHELDDAVLRRMVKRIYIPLPDENTRKFILEKNLEDRPNFTLSLKDIERVARETEGYSGIDLHLLCNDAAVMPLREYGPNIDIFQVQMRPVVYEDLKNNMPRIRRGLDYWSGQEEVEELLDRWNLRFGYT